MMAYKGTTKKSSEIAKEIRADAIVSGEARRLEIKSSSASS